MAGLGQTARNPPLLDTPGEAGRQAVITAAGAANGQEIVAGNDLGLVPRAAQVHRVGVIADVDDVGVEAANSATQRGRAEDVLIDVADPFSELTIAYGQTAEDNRWVDDFHLMATAAETALEHGSITEHAEGVLRAVIGYECDFQGSLKPIRRRYRRG